ncbi:hypothetical protein RND71_032195 [Anisodus tanguticus]|uniref:Uncharacterized protein n=1 Tax=Anisodus tanguticus TaxID=243964 RepID=A0AAE1RD64_9SOLA|nr:hypothetical protein RND71_032195 [Anisodus tanguticus]
MAVLPLRILALRVLCRLGAGSQLRISSDRRLKDVVLKLICYNQFASRSGQTNNEDPDNVEDNDGVYFEKPGSSNHQSTYQLEVQALCWKYKGSAMASWCTLSFTSVSSKPNKPSSSSISSSLQLPITPHLPFSKSSSLHPNHTLLQTQCRKIPLTNSPSFLNPHLDYNLKGHTLYLKTRFFTRTSLAFLPERSKIVYINIDTRLMKFLGIKRSGVLLQLSHIKPQSQVIKQWYLHSVEQVDQGNLLADILMEDKDILQVDIPVPEDNLVADNLGEEGKPQDILPVEDTVPEDIVLPEGIVQEDIVLRENTVHAYPFHLPFFSST